MDDREDTVQPRDQGNNRDIRNEREFRERRRGQRVKSEVGDEARGSRVKPQSPHRASAPVEEAGGPACHVPHDAACAAVTYAAPCPPGRSTRSPAQPGALRRSTWGHKGLNYTCKSL